MSNITSKVLKFPKGDKIPICFYFMDEVDYIMTLKEKLEETAKWLLIVGAILNLIAGGLSQKDAARKAANDFGVDPEELFKRFKNRKAG